MGRVDKRKIMLLASLVFAILVYFGYIILKKIDPVETLRTAGLRSISLSIALLVAGMSIRALRLYEILRLLGTRISLKSSLIARFTGNLAGLLTPGNLGAEPIRVLTVASLNSIPLESVMAAGVLESFYDSVLFALISFVFSFLYLPKSLLVLMVSAVLIALWFFGLLGFVYKESFWRKIIVRIAGKRYSEEIVEEIYRRYRLFASMVKIGINKRLHLEAVPLSLLALYVIVLSFFPLSHKSFGDTVFLVDSVVAYSMSFVMSIVPTPGGSGFFEYGLDVVLPGSTVALWRLVFILTTLIPGLVILLFMVRMRSILYDNIYRSVFAADSEMSSESSVSS